MTEFATLDVVFGNSTETLLDLFKDYLGIDRADTANDAELSAALNQAGDSIEVYLDRVIAKREVTEYFPHHFGTVILHDPQVDAAANVTVTVDGESSDDYSVYLMRGKVAHLTRTGHRPDMPMDWRPYDQVVVTYTAGFDPLPSDLGNAIIYTAAPVFASMGNGSIPGGSSGAIKSMSIYDVGSISYDVGSSSSGDPSVPGAAGIIPETATHMLARYARMAA